MTDYRFPFEKLEVWQDARRFVKQVYLATRGFPSEERFGLANQLNRAAVSVASNLAEGSCRISLKDQAHFSQLAYSSLMEAACQVTIAADLGCLDEDRGQVFRREINALANRINSLRQSQLARFNK